MYDNVTVYDKLKELEATGGSGGSGGGGALAASSSYTNFSDTLILERSGCSRVLQFKGNVTLSKILLSNNDRPYRQAHAAVVGIKGDGTNFIDIIDINTDGTIVSRFRDDQTESITYFGSGNWIVAVTESNTPVLNSDNNIRFNAENMCIEIFKDGAWEPVDFGVVKHVPELPENPDENIFYVVTDDEE